MKILVTGTAGFIGFHLANRLLQEGHSVVGLDCINDYYDTSLKFDRLEYAGIGKSLISYNKKITSVKNNNYAFYQLQLEDKPNLENLFASEKFDRVIHLAAQAGVRYSLTHPDAYVNSNIVGFVNILECSRHYQVTHLVYASSSSVYGLNKDIPFATSQNVDHPISLYAASKKSNELMAHVYSHLFGLPTTGLRFFTAYGTWGRPDMALFIFTKNILEGKPIEIYNNGNMLRDFTYIDDIVEGIVRVADRPPKGDAAWQADAKADPSVSSAPFKIYNIGNNTPVKLMYYIECIENALGKKAVKKFFPLQPGDVPATCADITDLTEDTGYIPATPVETGIAKFIEWFKHYYKLT